MTLRQFGWIVATTVFASIAAPLWASSYYTQRPDDPKAVYLTRGDQGVRGDGVSDDSDAIQRAIDKVQETTTQGIVFIPEGRYRISKTIFVWPGIRLIGYGQKRPVFVLGKDTPGFQKGIGYMVLFAGGRPNPANHRGRRRGEPIEGIVPPNDLIPDANPGTFYSAMSNIDFEIQEGTHVKLFAERGGESVTQDASGNVFIAAGQIYVYNAEGRLIDTIRVPERPIDLVFGGKDNRTLFILTHHSLYSVRTKIGGLRE